MPRRALVDHRPWLFASLIAGISYFFVADDAVPGAYLIAWKGAGVGFLAIYAWQRTRGFDGTLIFAVLALGAAGDIALELSLLIGGTIFAAGHATAIWLYARNRRTHTATSQRQAGWCLALATPLIALLIAYPLPNWQSGVAYAAVLGTMAGIAWTSRFPRYRVGVGAVLFILSDIVILAREAGRFDAEIAGWLIWPLYFSGQFLIATGVVQTLRGDHGGGAQSPPPCRR